MEENRAQRTVQLVVPTAPQFASVVRVAAVGLAALAHLDFDKTEDLRLAADEMWLYLRSLDAEIVTITFTYDPGTVHVQACAPCNGSESPEPTDDHLGWTVLRAITSRVAVVMHSGSVEISADISQSSPGIPHE